MAMREGHIAAATPAAVMYGWGFLMDPTVSWVDGWFTGTLAMLSVMAVCTAPDWDHPRFEGRVHPLAAASRWYVRLGYRLLATDKDRRRRGDRLRDTHRQLTHCLETAALMGLLAFGLLSISEQTRPVAWLVGLGVAIGWADHCLLDWCTPSGVPMSVLYNRWRHKEAFRRTTLSRRWATIPMGNVRVKVVPRPCILAADERAPDCCDKGWFKTDKGAEHAVVIPGFYALTVLLGLARAGVMALVLTMLTGLPL